jgi:hypothetical protein
MSRKVLVLHNYFELEITTRPDFFFLPFLSLKIPTSSTLLVGHLSLTQCTNTIQSPLHSLPLSRNRTRDHKSSRNVGDAEVGVILMNRRRSCRVPTASPRLARLTAKASCSCPVDSRQSEVLLHRAVFKRCRHPGFDVSMELAPVNTALLALLPANDFPGRFQRVGTNAARIERQLGSMDGAIDDVEVGVDKTQTARVDLV